MGLTKKQLVKVENVAQKWIEYVERMDKEECFSFLSVFKRNVKRDIEK